MSGASAYRPEIDGLRAIAVGGVVLYHFGMPGLSGGFTGVDVFLVISGYLIGAILWREYTQTGSIALGDFFLRRLRRLAPAWLVLAFVVFAAGYHILLPHDFRELGKALIAATLFAANIHFYRGTGYFDGAAEEKPLLHMWSLSLEEQFYLVLPLLLVICARRPRLALALIAGGGAASFAAGLAMTWRNGDAAFFLFPFRAWELVAGVLLAILTAGRPAPQGGRRALAGSALGLALVLGGMMLIRPGDGFPGVAALVPVAGTLLLIHFGQAAHPVNALLSAPPMRALGLISYSLYLWHWPVRSLSHFALGPDQGFAVTLALIGLSVGLAVLSWRFVEQPFRRPAADPRPLMAGAGLAMAALLALGAWPYLTAGVPGRWPAPVLVHEAAARDFIQDWSQCHIPETGPFAGVEICDLGPPGPPALVAWGDSHLRAIKEGLQTAAQEAGLPVRLIWRAGCPPLFGVAKTESAATPQEDAACHAANARIEQAFRADPPPGLLLVGRWSYYAEGGGVGLDAHNRITLDAPYDRSVRQTLDQLAAAGSRIWVMRQVPEIPGYSSLAVARAMARAEPVPPSRFITPRAEAERRETSGLAPFRAAAEAGQITLIDPWPRLCDARECGVMAEEDGTGGLPLYFDNNHLTNTGARVLRDLYPVQGMIGP